MIDAVDYITSCDICIKYKKTRPWPAVSLPVASDFNETVAMNLVNIGNKICFTDLPDLFKWFSVAKTITNKEKNVVTDAIFEIWLSHFGQPWKFLADNGAEYVNVVYNRHFSKHFSTTSKR